MRSSPFKTNHGFTATELLLAAAVVAVLLALAFPILGRISARSALVSCVSNERQLGIALGQYVGEHRGEWPYPGDSRVGVSPLGTWISRPLKEDGKLTGMGKLFPYIRDKRIYVCPADKTRMRSVQKATPYDSEDGTMPTSYVTRGFNQSAFPSQPNLKNVATMGRRAIHSCQFAYAPSNPKSFPLSWHDGSYPVLFSDGSVQVIRWPEGAVDPNNPPDINNQTPRQIRVWDFFDGHRTTLSF